MAPFHLLPTPLRGARSYFHFADGETEARVARFSQGPHLYRASAQGSGSKGVPTHPPNSVHAIFLSRAFPSIAAILTASSSTRRRLL